MRNSWQDGRWLFEEIGLSFHGGTTGNFRGFVDVEDGEIGTIWLILNDAEEAYDIAPGSYLHKSLIPQIEAALPGMIDWQAGGKANLTAHSRATRALVSP